MHTIFKDWNCLCSKKEKEKENLQFSKEEGKKKIEEEAYVRYLKRFPCETK